MHIDKNNDRHEGNVYDNSLSEKLSIMINQLYGCEVCMNSYKIGANEERRDERQHDPGWAAG